MSTILDLAGLDKRIYQIKELTNLNATPLMLTWMKIMEEDNRRGILSGTDKDGILMRPVKYRPKVQPPLKPDKAMRGGRKANATRGAFLGGIGNNLTSAQYRLLGGPPLAPRDQFSRVITNYRTDYAELRPGHWQATFWWEDVVNKDGLPFLRYHFDGTSKLPRRDLRGIRPQGVQKAMDALRNWARLAVRELFV